MKELEKILEEVKSSAVYAEVKGGYGAMCLLVGAIESIINKHMNGNAHCGECSRRKWYQKGFEDGKKSKGNWILVNDRLPENNEEVIAQWEFYSRCDNMTYTYIQIMRFDKTSGEWNGVYGIPNGRVIAWCPIPDPYRKEG